MERHLYSSRMLFSVLQAYSFFDWLSSHVCRSTSASPPMISGGTPRSGRRRWTYNIAPNSPPCTVTVLRTVPVATAFRLCIPALPEHHPVSTLSLLLIHARVNIHRRVIAPFCHTLLFTIR